MSTRYRVIFMTSCILARSRRAYLCHPALFSLGLTNWRQILNLFPILGWHAGIGVSARLWSITFEVV